MDVKLVVLGGKHPGQEIVVQGPEFLVGRAPECKLRPIATWSAAGTA